MAQKIGVLRFPGTNCDRDVLNWVQSKDGVSASFIWHLDQFNTKDYDGLVLPGGFSYGDYLRSGALAALSPVMKSVRDFAKTGKPILGICNGFQILCEAHLLPGTLVQNIHRRFIEDWQELEVVTSNKYFGSEFKSGELKRLPIAHGDGRFYVSDEDLKFIEDEGLVWLKYRGNPNGSIADIAGVMSREKNVVGLMPHPERAYLEWMGGTDGWGFL